MVSERPTSHRAALLCLLIVVLVVAVSQLYWVSRDRDALVTQTLFEDGFYYFQTSRAVAEGAGSVSVGGVAHNGYHPLWMWICAGVFRVVGDPLMAIRVILLLGILLGAASTFVIYRILTRLGCGGVAACAAAAFYAVNPWMRQLTTSGLEAPLNALLIALLVERTVAFDERRGERSYYALLGLLFALVYLVRTDNAFLLLATFLYLAWRGRGRTEGAVQRPLVALVAMGFFAAFLVLPWHVWNFLRFGEFMQTSAVALPVVREIVFFEQHPDATAGAFLVWRIGLFGGWFTAILWYTALGSLWYLLILALAGVVPYRRGRQEWSRFLAVLGHLLPLAIAVVCLGFVHKFLRLAAREWYYVASDVLLAVLWGVGTELLLRLGRRREGATGGDLLTRLAPLALAVALVGLPTAWLAKKSVRDWRDRLDRKRSYSLVMSDAFDALPDIAPDELFGSTDSGIMGFFCSRPIVNLDGVVNHDAAEAIRAGDLSAYVERMGIRYLLITPRMFNAEILGPDFRKEFIPHPPLTEQGYRFRPRVSENATPPAP